LEKVNNNSSLANIFIEKENFDKKQSSPQGNIIVDLKKDIIKKIKIYGIEGYLKYEGDYYQSKYSGFGKLYGGCDNKLLIYEGLFKDGLYEGKGILKDRYKYEYNGSFKEGKYHGFGKLYKYIDNNNYGEENKYLYYEGNFNLGKFEGRGELYYRGSEKNNYCPEIMYSGIFRNNEINGKGVKYYKSGAIKFDGIFGTINSCQGAYYCPLGDILYKGNLINEKPDDDVYIIIYDDDGCIQYEGQVMDGKYEGKGIEYSNYI